MSSSNAILYCRISQPISHVYVVFVLILKHPIQKVSSDVPYFWLLCDVHTTLSWPSSFNGFPCLLPHKLWIYDFDGSVVCIFIIPHKFIVWSFNCITVNLIVLSSIQFCCYQRIGMWRNSTKCHIPIFILIIHHLRSDILEYSDLRFPLLMRINTSSHLHRKRSFDLIFRGTCVMKQDVQKIDRELFQWVKKGKLDHASKHKTVIWLTKATLI